MQRWRGRGVESTQGWRGGGVEKGAGGRQSGSEGVRKLPCHLGRRHRAARDAEAAQRKPHIVKP